MTILHSDSVSIHRLRIQHPAELAGSDLAQTTGRVRRQIEWSDWPEAPGRSWVFIRRLQVRAAETQLAQQLVQAARRKISSGDYEVMRFADLTELLAALVTDLVQGQVQRRWYWRRWSQLFRLDLATALTRLLSEHLEQLPAVCARLGQQRQLAQLWNALDVAGAKQLSGELAWRSGFTPPAAAQVEKELKIVAQRGRAHFFRLDQLLVQRWAPILAQFSPDDSRRQLALLLLGQEVAPLLLQQAPARLLAQLTLALQAAAAEKLPAPPSAVSEKKTAREPAGQEAANIEFKESTDNVKAHLQPYPGEQAQPTPSSEQEQRGDRLTVFDSDSANFSPHSDTSVSQPPQSDAGSMSSPDPAPAAWLPEESSPSSNLSDSLHPALILHEAPKDQAFVQFATRQGGLLYLLNFLNRTEALALLADSRQQFVHGWGWLYRLGQELQLDESDPLAGFIATQLGFDGPEKLASLPPLPERDRLLNLARKWYGRAGLWQPQLLAVTGRVLASPSHVDFYASMETVKMRVRLAGLDLDPGWLPWLGRVVSLHFE